MKPTTCSLAVLILGALIVSCLVSSMPDLYSGDPGAGEQGTAPPAVLESIDLSGTRDGDSPEDYGFIVGIIDTTYTLFQGLRFTYRTTADPKKYTVQLRNLSVLPIDP
jgi:hypothetical protein